MTDSNNALSNLTPAQAEALPAVIQQVLGPIMENMARMFAQNAQALEQIAATQQAQADRMEALEKQIRLNTLVTTKQVQYINNSIRARARELLMKKEIEDAKAIQKISNAIRKSILSRYGVAALHEIPKHEYSVVMNQVNMWNDMLCMRDVVKEVRSRESE